MKTFRSSLPATMVLTTHFLFPSVAGACTWADGYFHQVTQLRGSLVGVKYGDLRHPFRFLRQRVVVGEARLTLYRYPFNTATDVTKQVLKTVTTDGRGTFDFGPVPLGHYTLLIASTRGTDRFDVEITRLRRATRSVLIDVSPNYPDCTGGHEFISSQE